MRVGAGTVGARIDRRFAFSAFSRTTTRSLSRHASCARIRPTTSASLAYANRASNRAFERVVKFGTDLPVALSATG